MGHRGLLTLYNALQATLLPLAGPPLLLYGLSRRKYRRHLAARLGFGRLGPAGTGTPPRIWVHALSVGEVNTAIPMVEGLRRRWPRCTLFLSASTATGVERLQGVAPPGAVVLAAPLDLFPAVARRVREMAPHLFFLVETDIWPNTIHLLRASGCATVLANGAISSAAARRLARFPALARLLYSGFHGVVMQSEPDRSRLASLVGRGVRLLPPGNLKYDKFRRLPPVDPAKFGLRPEDGPVLTAGSTHPGEEQILLQALERVRREVPTARLVVAPRAVQRGEEVFRLARFRGFSAALRSRAGAEARTAQVLVLDTLGELMECYGLAHAAFVGGSLVEVGGHDLLEPAAWSIPVLFGPHCESCEEVAEELMEAGGGLQVADGDQLARTWSGLLTHPERAREMGRRARGVVEGHAGVVDRYIELAEELLHGVA